MPSAKLEKKSKTPRVKKAPKIKAPSGKYLVIVESPAKARTISKILGANYEVTSSMGHVVDLPSSKLAVDVEHGFTPQYRVIPGKEKLIGQIKKMAKGKDIIYLATDPDREGEAISWHLKEKLMDTGAKFARVTFHEITESAIKEAIAAAGEIDQKKVEAQTARRVLDRVVGYNLSPLLWKKIARGLSAGRVQSVALKFIVDREEEIAKFVPAKTYSVEASFKSGEALFNARLTKFKEGKNPIFVTEEEARLCVEQIKASAYSVTEVTKKESRRKPPPPYTTSLLQQDAYARLHFSSKKTMFVAQKLYEGIDIREESTGLITYMRTDSFYINPKAKAEGQEFIEKTFGKNYLADKNYGFKEKKGAQMAHEAIRPTAVSRLPSDIKQFLTEEEERLYALIWSRFLAGLMQEAVFENSRAIVSGGDAEFTAEGKKLVFDGFLRVYGQSEEMSELPDIADGSAIELANLEIREHITKPPPRYNDASLVKLMEEKGIGRPSTYAPTVSTLIDRSYIKRERAAFMPTELGIRVSHILAQSFEDVINEDFTAAMEEKLDKVEEGEVEWVKVLSEFFPAFKAKVDAVSAVATREVILAGKNCPKCGANLVIKWSRRGEFLSCEKFPECRYAESITTDVACPDCKEGKLIKRRNQRGQFFYGCSRFPECRYTSRWLPNVSKENKVVENNEQA